MVVGGVVVKIPVDKSKGKTVEVSCSSVTTMLFLDDLLFHLKETAKSTGGKRKSLKKKRMTKVKVKLWVRVARRHADLIIQHLIIM